MSDVLDEEYEASLCEELARLELILGREHPEVAEALSCLAAHRSFRGDEVEAEALYRRILAIRETACGLEHGKLVETLVALADLKRRTNHYQEAAALLDRAFAIQQQDHSLGYWICASIWESKARLAEAQNQPEKAARCFQRPLAIYETHEEPGSYELSEAYWRLGLFYELQGNLEEVLSVSARLLPLMDEEVGDTSILDYFALHARALYGLGRTEEWRALVARIKALLVERKLDFEVPGEWLTGQASELTSEGTSPGTSR